MSKTSDNNKRILKNTILLYCRMMLLMFVGLFTSRVVLNTLGIEDYGIYNVVGGVVAMFGFINNAMTSATTRFITFALGENKLKVLKSIFNTSILIHLCIAVLIIIVGETIGLWFFYEKINIPLERVNAGFWVYQFSLLSAIIMIFSIPYNATIIAHEKMSAFAYITILDAILKLAVVFAIINSSYDKLVSYSFLILLTQIINCFVYLMYCIRKFPESHIKLEIHKKIFKEMLSFASWSLWGCTANIAYTQGVNIILNLFFGPVVNAARGIAVQVQNIINNFAVNFQTAVNPQIIKYHAQNDFNSMHSLIFRSSKFSFYLLLLVSLPLFFEADLVLLWWLNKVPENTALFLRLILITTILDTISNPIMKSVDASGKIKRYHMIIGGTLILIAPVSYLCLEMGAPAYSVFIVHICFCIIALILRLFIVKPLIDLSIEKYIKSVILPMFKVGLCSMIVPFILMAILEKSIISFMIMCFSCVISVTICIWALGLESNEKDFLITKIINFKNKW